VYRALCAIDLFCGAGGLSLGLKKAGFSILAGIDSDPTCRFPFTSNIGASFIEADVRGVSGGDLARLYPKGAVRLLAGCAPCTPFSPHRRGTSNTTMEEWGLVRQFGRIARELRPDLVTMENVPRLGSKKVFRDFLRNLSGLGYEVAWRSVYCPAFGIPQHRRRLVLMASLIGAIQVPTGFLAPGRYPTVRQTIGSLPRVAAGCQDPTDRLHRARALSALNLRRVRASTPGGTWEDWPKELRAKCHLKQSGATYRNVYSRMAWDEPAPTITTLAHNFGTGRFGHPEQNRAITLREAALLQTFPKRFRFVGPDEEVSLVGVGRLIGNAVPPRLAYFIGSEMARVGRALPRPG
jgi:DNA (cytosine-5)-methyltransferase 1